LLGEAEYPAEKVEYNFPPFAGELLQAKKSNSGKIKPEFRCSACDATVTLSVKCLPK